MDVGLLFESANYLSELRGSFFRAESATAGRKFVCYVVKGWVLVYRSHDVYIFVKLMQH